MTINRFTPASIGDLRFTIPLYQRLFEWEEKQIDQLLRDLYFSFGKNKEQPYYIGMLTAFKENNYYSLVDGQQRFTVLTLMAIAFKTAEWKRFLFASNNNYRLSFFGRKKDKAYLQEKISGNFSDNGYKNAKMEAGLEFIEAFVKSKEDAQDFIEYIYGKATFFISELPESYTPQDLNRYFESMNAAGKGLENHEILKVHS